jgi:hypothetical protein
MFKIQNQKACLYKKWFVIYVEVDSCYCQMLSQC